MPPYSCVVAWFRLNKQKWSLHAAPRNFHAAPTQLHAAPRSSTQLPRSSKSVRWHVLICTFFNPATAHPESAKVTKNCSTASNWHFGRPSLQIFQFWAQNAYQATSEAHVPISGVMSPALTCPPFDTALSELHVLKL